MNEKSHRELRGAFVDDWKCGENNGNRGFSAPKLQNEEY